MLHSLALPKYNKVRKYEGLGNYAISKYYKFPYSIFYRKKLRMVIDQLDNKRIYNNILDFGSGKAEIFRDELERHALHVKCVDRHEEINQGWKFDVIICASVLEFVNLPIVLSILKSITAQNGMIVISSPMDTWLSRLYFKIIGDKNRRYSHKDIVKESSKYYFIANYKQWFGLYFSFRGYPK